MKRLVRLIVLFVLALPVVPFLPLYVERTMLRSFRIGSAGDKIDWGWKLTSLSDYWSNYRHMSREQSPDVWLAVDIALALLYAFLIASAVYQVFAWRQKRKSKASSMTGSAQP